MESTLLIDSPLISEVDFYFYRAGKLIRAKRVGENYPGGTGTSQLSGYAVPLWMSSGESVQLLIRVYKPLIPNFDFHLINSQIYQEHNANRQIRDAMLVGAVITIIVILVFFTLSNRDLHSVLYAVSNLLLAGVLLRANGFFSIDTVGGFRWLNQWMVLPLRSLAPYYFCFTCKEWVGKSCQKSISKPFKSI